MIVAQWVNPEETTMEACIDGTTSYIVITIDGKLQALPEIAETIQAWILEGNLPLPYNGGKT
jgi:hypothetical protein